MKLVLRGGVVAAVVFVLALPCGAGQVSGPEAAEGAELAQLPQRIAGLWKDLEAWEEAGKGPVPSELLTGVEGLWRINRSHSQDAHGQRAGAEALHLLVHLERHDDLERRVAGLGTDDALWSSAFQFLAEAAQLSGDSGPLIRIAKARLETVEDPVQRARTWLVLGDALSRKGRREEASAAYHQVIEAVPGSRLARRAEGNLHELQALQPGQPAPAFSTVALDGRSVSLAGYAGKVVLLDVWASW
jgi:tetratricopeptide (TPR) repeat protein